VLCSCDGGIDVTSVPASASSRCPEHCHARDPSPTTVTPSNDSPTCLSPSACRTARRRYAQGGCNRPVYHGLSSSKFPRTSRIRSGAFLSLPCHSPHARPPRTSCRCTLSPPRPSLLRSVRPPTGAKAEAWCLLIHAWAAPLPGACDCCCVDGCDRSARSSLTPLPHGLPAPLPANPPRAACSVTLRCSAPPTGVKPKTPNAVAVASLSLPALVVTGLTAPRR
jgi:hypothetical protein